MKTYLLLLSLTVIGLANAQEANTNKLQALSQKFQSQYEANQELISKMAKEKNLDEKKLRKHFLGKYGKFLVYIENTDTEQAKVTNTDMLYNNTIPGVAVTGEGMTVYQWDGGRIETTHSEFGGRATNNEPNDVGISGHATSVAGVMVASGVFVGAKGMAPEANVIGYDYFNNITEISNESIQNIEYMLSNHSYGYQAGWRYGDYDDTIGEGWYWFGYPSMDENESVFHGIYSDLDSSLDQIARSAPNHLMIKSAGNDRNSGPTTATSHAVLNDQNSWEISNSSRPVNCGYTGYDCIPYGAMAKNILLVGSINEVDGDGRYNGPASVTSSSFSSFGPTDDGRIKPDVVTQGSNVTIATNNNGYYSNGNGTSFSAPSATGISVLLQQLYHQLHNEYMNAATLKALIINTTNEAGNAPGPDYQFGFGLVDAFQAANLIVDANNNEAVILKGTKGAEELSYELTATGDAPIRATLVWIDPAKPAESLIFEVNDRTPMLINDLDLRITENSSFTEYMPWTLDVENPSVAAVPGDNVLDNVEQILIPGNQSGEFTLNVRHKGEINGITQNFAIVVSGAQLTTQATKDVNLAKTSIYPNPTSDVLHIKGLEGETQVQVINANGQIVFTDNLNGQVVDVRSLPKGAYILTLKNTAGTTAHKFIKK